MKNTFRDILPNIGWGYFINLTSAMWVVKRKPRFLVLFALVLTAFLTLGADYAREKKWADEIVSRIVVGDPVYLEEKNGHKFLAILTEAANPKAALLIIHGMGAHPDWGLIGMLRTELVDEGYTTLALQMPLLAGDAKPEDYLPTFGEASERLKVAVGFLRSKGYKTIALVSHSMGSRMTLRYLTKYHGAGISPNFSPIEKIKAALCGIMLVSPNSYAKGEERPYENRVYNRTNGISAPGASCRDREI